MAASLTPKRAVSYLRVSTREQAQRSGAAEGFSIPAQREANKKKAMALGALIVKEFVDRGESARSANRPELQKMLHYLQDAGDIDYVIVHKLDRLARNRADDVDINRILDQTGTRLISTTENIDQTPGGILLHGIMSSIAEFYSRNLANEVVKGLSQKARAGGTIGRAPLGYLNKQGRDEQGREARRVDIDPVRGPLITQAFTEYATDRWTLSTLTDHLTAQGLTTVPTPSRPSHPLGHNKLLAILRNPYYRGIVTYQGVQYPGKHQPLIDDATWQRVQTILNQHRHGERQRIHNHHLKTTIRCGQCGGRLIIHNAKARNGHIYPYFVCSYRQRHRTKCSFKAVLIDEVDARIADLYHHIHITPEDRRTIEKYLRIELDHIYARQHTHTQTLTTQARKLKTQQAKLLEAHYADAIPLDLLKTEQTRLTRELDHITQELATLTADRERVEQHLKEALTLLEHCHHLYTHPDTPPSLKKLLNTIFFTEILINPDDNTPTSTPQRPIHPTPRPPFDQLTNPTLRHDAGLTNPGKNRRSESARRNDSSDQGNDDSRDRHGDQDNGSIHIGSNSAHLDQTTARTGTATISPVAAIAATHSSTDITSHPNQASTTATSRGSTAGTAARTATTQLPSNQKTLQEELPEGDTHIHLGDVSCKSLVVGVAGIEPATNRL
ncbi:recombinase family protein [Candidatus Saccharibacteria bacterium oral taxon 488]|nr:recombinase family protein [Candidatus Saccharibacteria bacterium oral taxon 488]